jgi:hypothetical protein
VLTLTHALQVVGILVGGVFAGAGQRRAAVLGLFLGLINGVVLLGAEIAVQQASNQAAESGSDLLTQLFVQMVCGGLGGFIGGFVWKPIVPIIGPEPTVPTPTTHLTTLTGVRRVFRPFRGPIAWFRCIVGVTAVSGISLASNWILLNMLRQVTARSSAEASVSWLQLQFATWEISVLGMVIGAGYAGANTKNGLKQGLVVGIASSILLLVFHFQGMMDDIPQTILFKYFLGFGRDPNDVVALVTMTLSSVIPLGMLGGWFGSQLLPPLLRIAPKEQKRMIAHG